MGIIQKQTLRGSFYSYLGVLVGFITTGILYPRILSTDEIGLVNLLVSFSVLFAQFASLGFNGVINRLFPYFRNSRNGHNGFLMIALIVSASGFLITYGIFELYKPVLIRNNIEESALLVQYIDYIVPLIFFTLFFNLFDSYNKAIYDAVLGTIAKEFLQRIFILVALLFYFFNLIKIETFITLYAIAVSSPALIMIISLMIRGEFRIRMPSREIFTKKMIREMIDLSIFGILAGFGTLAILHIDRILVNKFLGLSATGIYATNFFFATLIVIPSRSLLKIATTILADSWKSGDLDNILLVYKKSVINQGVFALLIFTGLWVNIDNIYQIIPPEFAEGKWVILFIGLANIIQMISGVSGTIILTSERFRIHTYFIIIFLASLIGFNYILIPRLGLTGAALASTISSLIFNLLRCGYVYFKFGMNPFDYRIFLLAGIGLVSYLAGYVIPQVYFITDIIIRSAVVAIVFLSLIFFFRISEDLNNLVIKFLKKQTGK